MSAVPVDSSEQEYQTDVQTETDELGRRDGSDETAVAGTPVVVRRSAGVAALVGYTASAVAIAYLWRASQTMTALDWALCALMAVIAGVYLTSLVDARTPLLVADDLGVRIRLGSEWRGLPWEAIGHVVVHPRRGSLRDGRLVFAPRNLSRALEGLDVKARRHVALNQKMYGAPLAVPLGSTTRVTGSAASKPGGSAAEGVAGDIAALALGRAEVVVLDPETLEVVDQRAEPDLAGQDSRAQDSRAQDRAVQTRREHRPSSTDVYPPRARLKPREAVPEDAEDSDAADDGQSVEVSNRRQVVFPANGVELSWKPRGQASASAVEGHGSATSAPTAPTPPGETAARRPRRNILGGIGTIVSRVGKGRDRDVDRDVDLGGHGSEVGPESGSDAGAQFGSEAGAQFGAEAGAQFGAEAGSEAGSRTGARAGSEQAAAPDATPAGAPTGAESGARPAGRPSACDGDGRQTPAGTSASQTEGDAGEAPADASPEVRPEPAKPPFATAALRETRPGLRAEAKLDLPPTAGNTALEPSASQEGRGGSLPEGRELRRPGNVDLALERIDEDRVRPISTLGDAVEPLVIDDYVTEPAYDPVIGPELAAARTRLGLSVDDLAERTRIRPHVIESIEVDDFAPCGGDFYARGHLRTLARILGLRVDPLLEKFEERYATAPINARRVFEAELATGMTGSMRSTVGGPSWGLLVGVVLVLVLVWGVLRLFTTEPADVQAPVIHGAAAVATSHAAPSPAPSSPHR